MARRKSFLEQMWAGSEGAKAQRERENRKIEEHVARSAERARARTAAADAAKQAKQADADRVRGEQELARIDRERAQGQLTADLQDRNEGLQYYLRRLSQVLQDRERVPGYVLEEVGESFLRGGADEFGEAVERALSDSRYPSSVGSRTAVLAYRPEVRELIIERELPRTSAIPVEQEYRLVRGEVTSVPRRPAEVRHLYGQLLARVALRTVAEAFALTPAALVDSVVLNGRVTAVDQATGQPVHPHLLSVQFTRRTFAGLHLDAPELDPELCLRRHNAQISPHPHDLVPVKPLLYYDLERYKTIAGLDLLVDLDHRLDLLTLDPGEFETLVRTLFEARGLRSWQTQSSRDDGIDAIAVNEDPVVGGVTIIQAKRYSKVVPFESVTALAGVLHHNKEAVRGILVTTSWVGLTSRQFAQENRIQIIEGRELKQLLAEHLNMDVLIGLPKLPPGWERAEVA